jgi:hypothetical protein
MSRLPPAGVGGMELTFSEVSSATPMMPMKGSIGNSARSWLLTGSTPR